MAPSLSIRPAIPGDARGIAEVHVRTWQDTYAGQMPAEYLAGLSVAAREEMWVRVLGTAVSGSGAGREGVAGAGKPTGTGESAGAGESTGAGKSGEAGTTRTWVWVAVDPDDQVRGFVCFVDGPGADPADASGEILPEIRAIYMSPGHQSAGAGRRLLETALDQARVLDGGGARLAVLEGNDRARQFYERHGFRCVRRTLDRLTPEVLVPHVHYELRWNAGTSPTRGTRGRAPTPGVPEGGPNP